MGKKISLAYVGYLLFLFVGFEFFDMLDFSFAPGELYYETGQILEDKVDDVIGVANVIADIRQPPRNPALTLAQSYNQKLATLSNSPTVMFEYPSVRFSAGRPGGAEVIFSSSPEAAKSGQGDVSVHFSPPALEPLVLLFMLAVAYLGVAVSLAVKLRAAIRQNFVWRTLALLIFWSSLSFTWLYWLGNSNYNRQFYTRIDRALDATVAAHPEQLRQLLDQAQRPGLVECNFLPAGYRRAFVGQLDQQKYLRINCNSLVYLFYAPDISGKKMSQLDPSLSFHSLGNGLSVAWAGIIIPLRLLMAVKILGAVFLLSVWIFLIITIYYNKIRKIKNTFAFFE